MVSDKRWERLHPRCLALQASGVDGFNDVDIRNNMIGMVIGAIPTLNKAAVQALDRLLDRPDALEKAQAAARADDVKTVTASLMEAMGYNPVNPLIYRQPVCCYLGRRWPPRSFKRI
jgi:cytochrome P450